MKYFTTILAAAALALFVTGCASGTGYVSTTDNGVMGSTYDGTAYGRTYDGTAYDGGATGTLPATTNRSTAGTANRNTAGTATTTPGTRSTTGTAANQSQSGAASIGSYGFGYGATGPVTGTTSR
ncbi:MAG: hypothetical protein PHS97_02550 [Oscillospiraceae bacterium]|nr:hypothetical protein [Oscillospiraceae bacterium]